MNVMSVKVMALVFDYAGLSSSEKFVLLAYADHADHSGNNVFPSVAFVARKTNYNDRTVQRTSRKLEQDGYHIPDGRGRKGTKKWRINVNKLMGAAESHPGRKSHSEVAESHSGRESRSEVAENPIRGGTESPESSLNHQVKPSSFMTKSTMQEYFLEQFGAKRFKTRIQKETILKLETMFGTDTLREAIDWAAKQGMNMGRAILSIETALPKWTKSKKNVVENKANLPGYTKEELQQMRSPHGH